MSLILNRFLKTDKFTAGYIDVAGQRFYTLERPWQENEQNVSCIPHGLYNVKPYSSKRFPNTFQLMNVIDRSYILIHKGNYTRDTEGCILIGMNFDTLDGQGMVEDSTIAMNKFRNIVGDAEFKLEIREN